MSRDTMSESVSTSEAAEFLSAAVRSRLISGERAKQIHGKLPRKATAEGLAQQLVKTGELTPFQTKKLLEGVWQGLVIGPFHILKPIGRGGMGVVYLAKDSREKNLQVALKILPPRKAAAEPRTKARFLREVKIGRELPQAENIARVFDTGVIDGIAFIAMEFVPGRTVKSVVAATGPLTVTVSAHIFAGVAQALAAAHEKEVIHRDVKPSNIMITPEGQAKLVDFGFAIRQGEEGTDASVIGGAGYALGTFDFIPPEQAANAATVTPLADQYSLGCSMYYALTAQPPFPGGDAKAKIQKHRWEDPVPLSALRPDLPREYTQIVERMMEKAPEQRYPSCRAVAKALLPWSQNVEASSNVFAEELIEDDSDDLDELQSPMRLPRRQPQSSLAVGLGVSVGIAAVVALLAFLLSR